MYRNKYGLLKRGLFALYEALPPTRRIRNYFSSFRTRSFAKRLEARKREMAAYRAAHGQAPLFGHVEIETINRCNGRCAFCPVNHDLDRRPFHRMDEALFHAIVEQLAELEYTGEVCLFSNNESLMDNRIEAFVAAARRRLPGARMVLSTNGTLLTPERYRELIDNLDVLYVNNYCDDFKLTPGNQAILELSRSRPDWWEKTHVVVRYVRELMSSRGGQAPNKRDDTRATLGVGCLLPASQLIIRPDGKVSLCCNDASGVVTMGDAAADRLVDIWRSPRFEEVRLRLLEGRDGFSLCRHCDTLND